MTLEAIHEQLLRAIGVGIALAGEERLDIRFHNEKFAEWFGAPAPDTTLGALFPDVDLEALRADLAAGRPDAVELRVKPKRRMLVIALSVSRAVSERQLDSDRRVPKHHPHSRTGVDDRFLLGHRSSAIRATSSARRSGSSACC